jgi:hypothetical protein
MLYGYIIILYYIIMSIGLLITTCPHYFTNIPNIIQNIEDCNIPKENVVIVSGQENDNSIYYENNIKIVKVDYSGLHLTGAIYASENIDSFKHIEYWVILPDTIKMGKLFYVNIMKYYDTYLKNTGVYSLPFINPRLRPTMDMGIIHINHIYNMSDYLYRIKLSKPYTIDDILNLKKQLIYDEDTLLGLSTWWPQTTKFKYINPLFPRPTFFIANDTTELTEKKITINNRLLNEVYVVNIDLYKYQRNFLGIDKPLIMEL